MSCVRLSTSFATLAAACSTRSELSECSDTREVTATSAISVLPRSSHRCRDEFTFENEAASRNCTVHGFDPTVRRGFSAMKFHFHPVGLGSASSVVAGIGRVRTLSELRLENGHSTRLLSLLKVRVDRDHRFGTGSPIC
eukprot:6792767-Prymnesium_polylepis.2